MNVKTTIFDFLIKHAKKNPISFHMPGHKGAAIYKRLGYDEFLSNFMDCDITEIPGADNLFQAEGIIKEAQERYSKLYDVKKSYFLINGTSGGIIASIMASVPKHKKIIMARNCHKSVFNALTLADIQPVYAYPSKLEEFNISGSILPGEIQTLLANNPEVEAVILPSPNYYGICSDIEAIAKIVHSYGKVLIVDQAHGAHLKFFNKFGVKGMPKSAEESGADIVINSIHKTLASYTQSAVLNLNSDRVDSYMLEDKLQAIQSTSPSYILMAALDINASILEEHGSALMKEWADNLNYFYNNASKIEGLHFIDKVSGFDWTKINFSLGEKGISGIVLEELLLAKNVFIELFTGDLVMCMTGIGNSRSDIEILLNSLDEISKADVVKTSKIAKNYMTTPKQATLFEIPNVKTRVKLEDAEGMICASSIIPYPPGIPLICPGERLEKDAIQYIKALRENEEKVIGINDLGEITVGK